MIITILSRESIKTRPSVFELNLLLLSTIVNGSPFPPLKILPESKRVPPTLPPNGASGGRLAEEIAEVFRFRKDNVASYVNQAGMRV